MRRLVRLLVTLILDPGTVQLLHDGHVQLVVNETGVSLHFSSYSCEVPWCKSVLGGLIVFRVDPPLLPLPPQPLPD